jgi:thiol-disulfide isomerase/thioredoxin
MKKGLLALCTLLLFLSCRAEAQNNISPDIAKAFANAGIPVLRQRANPIDFSLPLLNGRTAKLSAYKGKVVLLNFWATWCPPCRAEMPSMETFYQRFKDQGLEILAVNGGEDTATVQDFLQNNRYSFPVLMDTRNEVNGIYEIKAIPTTFILDREGKIIVMIVGSLRWDDPKIIAAMETLLKSR